MEQSQYRALRRERKTTLAGGTTAAAGVGDMWLHSSHDVSVLNWIYDGLATVTGTEDTLLAAAEGNTVALAGGLALAAGAQLARARRESATAERRRLYSSAGWASTANLWDFTGRPALVREARKTRPGLGWRRRVFTRTARELGIRVGTAISGSSSMVHGRSIYSSFEHGLLVLGEPGAWKSAFLADKLLDLPGPAVVTSTKTEFWDTTSELREAQRGPVWVFDPYAEVPHADEVSLRFDLVSGCRDVEVAMRRAEALMAASMGAGVKDSSFWEGRGRNLMTALLTAADLGQRTLRDVAGWLTSEDYAEPMRILTHAKADHPVEETQIKVLTSLTKGGSGAAGASGSAAQTAAQVLEFLSNPKLAEPLCPDRNGRSFDFDDFLVRNGTVYLVTGEASTLSPIVAAFAAELREAVKRHKRVEGARLDPPLGIIYDEAHLSVPSVPVHDHAAEMRSYGVTHILASQNYAQLKAKWGDDEAKTLRTCLQTHVVLAAHDQDDREYWSRRIGKHTQWHVKTSASTPNSVKTRLLGNPLRKGVSQNEGHDAVQVETFPPGCWSDLKPGQAVVIPNKGRAVVVSIEHGLIRAEKSREALRADRTVAETLADRRSRRQPAAEPQTAEGGETR